MDTFWFCKGWLFYSTLLVVISFVLIFVLWFLHGLGVFSYKTTRKNPLSSEWDFEAPLAGFQSIVTLVAFFREAGCFRTQVMEKVTFIEAWAFLVMIVLLGLGFFFIDMVIGVMGCIIGLATKTILKSFFRLI